MSTTRNEVRAHLLALDAAHALAVLNADYKHQPQRRNEVYKLKRRLLAAFWDAGYCVAAEREFPWMWCFTYRVNGHRFRWHLPHNHVTFQPRAFTTPGATTGSRPTPPAANYRQRIRTIKRYLAHVNGVSSNDE